MNCRLLRCNSETAVDGAAVQGGKIQIELPVCIPGNEIFKRIFTKFEKMPIRTCEIDQYIILNCRRNVFKSKSEYVIYVFQGRL